MKTNTCMTYKRIKGLEFELASTVADADIKGMHTIHTDFHRQTSLFQISLVLVSGFKS